MVSTALALILNISLVCTRTDCAPQMALLPFACSGTSSSLSAWSRRASWWPRTQAPRPRSSQRIGEGVRRMAGRCAPPPLGTRIQCPPAAPSAGSSCGCTRQSTWSLLPLCASLPTAAWTAWGGRCWPGAGCTPLSRVPWRLRWGPAPDPQPCRRCLRPGGLETPGDHQGRTRQGWRCPPGLHDSRETADTSRKQAEQIHPKRTDSKWQCPQNDQPPSKS